MLCSCILGCAHKLYPLQHTSFCCLHKWITCLRLALLWIIIFSSQNSIDTVLLSYNFQSYSKLWKQSDLCLQETLFFLYSSRVYLFINSYIQQTFVEYLLCVKHWSRHSSECNRPKSLPLWHWHSSGGKQMINKMNESDIQHCWEWHMLEEEYHWGRA